MIGSRFMAMPELDGRSFDRLRRKKVQNGVHFLLFLFLRSFFVGLSHSGNASHASLSGHLLRPQTTMLRNAELPRLPIANHWIDPSRDPVRILTVLVALNVSVNAVVTSFLDSGGSRVRLRSQLKNIVTALDCSIQSQFDLALIVFQRKELRVRLTVALNSNLPAVRLASFHSANVLVLYVLFHVSNLWRGRKYRFRPIVGACFNCQ